jgi:uncharacterized membrane protein YqhA
VQDGHGNHGVAGDGGTSAPAGGAESVSPLGRLIERSRYLAAVPALGMVLLALASVIWAVVVGGQVMVDLVQDVDDLDLIGDLLKVTDLFLIGIVFLIVGIGFWELFVEDLDLPDWLSITSLSDLKNKLIDTLLLVLGVYFVEQVLSGTDTDELVELAIAIGIVSTVFVLFRVLRAPGRSG